MDGHGVSALQLLLAELIVAAILALIVAAVFARQASRDLCLARAMRAEARQLVAEATTE